MTASGGPVVDGGPDDPAQPARPADPATPRKRPATLPPLLTVHASAVVLGEVGVLIRGPSGAGKSFLARHLVDHHAGGGRFARLVADDRVILERHGAALVARVPPPIEGRMELRGLGIVEAPVLAAVRLDLVVDLVAPDAISRLPEPREAWVSLMGVRLARLAAPRRCVCLSAPLVACALGRPGLTTPGRMSNRVPSARGSLEEDVPFGREEGKR